MHQEIQRLNLQTQGAHRRQEKLPTRLVSHPTCTAVHKQGTGKKSVGTSLSSSLDCSGSPRSPGLLICTLSSGLHLTHRAGLGKYTLQGPSPGFNSAGAGWGLRISTSTRSPGDAGATIKKKCGDPECTLIKTGWRDTT